MIDEGTFYEEAAALYGEGSDTYDRVISLFDYVARHDEARAVEILRNMPVQVFAEEYGLVPERTHEHSIGERLI